MQGSHFVVVKAVAMSLPSMLNETLIGVPAGMARALLFLTEARNVTVSPTEGLGGTILNVVIVRSGFRPEDATETVPLTGRFTEEPPT